MAQTYFRSMKKMLHACVSVCVCAFSVLYLAALNFSASCSPHHMLEVIPLMTEPEMRVRVCPCTHACMFVGEGKAWQDLPGRLQRCFS